MIELALMLRAIQGIFMVYEWTMAIQFSFDHKSEEEINSIAVDGVMQPKALTDAIQDGGVPSKH